MSKQKEEQLVLQHGGLVVSVINSLQIPKNLFDDCYACGNLGLIKGIRSYKTKKCKLSTWLYKNIKWEILKFIKTELKHQHKPLKNNIPLVTDENIKEYLPNLTKTEARILELRLQSYNFQDIAQMMGLSKTKHIYSKYDQIIQKIRRKNKY